MPARLWKRLIWAGTTGIESHALRVRVAMTNQISAVVVLMVGAIVISLDALGLRGGWTVMLPPLLLLAGVPVLNKLRRRTLARLAVIVGVLGCIYSGASLLGTRAQVQLFAYPTMLMAVVLFHRRETVQMWTGIVLTIVVNTLIGFELLIPMPVPAVPLWTLDGIRAFALSGSLALLVYTFWQNHVQLMSLVFRNLDKERARNELLVKKDLELQEYSARLEAQNKANDATLAELRRSKQQLEEQAHLTEHSQRELSVLVKDLQEKQAVLELNRYYDQGMAQLAGVLRWDETQDPEAWASRIVTLLVRYIEGLHGALYRLEPASEGATTLWLMAAYGVGDLGALERRMAQDGSLVGQVTLTRKPVHLTGLERQAARVRTLSTAAGALQPAELLVVPLEHSNHVLGALELVGASAFGPRVLGFVERVAPLIAAGLVSLRHQQHIFDLLKQKDTYAEQLIEREQLLHKNIEKLVSANHDIKFTERKLRQLQQELQLQNQVLQSQLSQREGELGHTRQRLDHLQRQAEQSERLVVAGMAAGKVNSDLQHQLGLIKAADDNLALTLPRLAEGLARLSAGIDQNQRVAFYELARRVIARPLDTPTQGGTERARRRTLTQQLSEAQVADADEVARRLVEAGLDGEVSPYLNLLASPSGPLAVDLITAVAQMRQNVATIGQAVDHERRMALALGQVLHLNLERSSCQLKDQVNTALTLLQPELKGLELVVHLEPVPTLIAPALRLQQAVMVLLEQTIKLLKRRGRTHLVLLVEGTEVVLRVLNDETGLGSEQAQLLQRSDAPEHPLQTVHTTAEALGGTLEVFADGRHVRIELRLPLPSEPQLHGRLGMSETGAKGNGHEATSEGSAPSTTEAARS